MRFGPGSLCLYLGVMLFSSFAGASLRLDFAVAYQPVVLGISSVGISENAPGPVFGAHLGYQFHDHFGIITGIESVTRTFPLIGGRLAQVQALELPLGVSFSSKEFLGWNAFRSYWAYGLGLSLPLSALKTREGDVVQQTQPALTVFASATALRPLTSSLFWGPSFYCRLSLSQAYLETAFGRLTRNLELGIAILVAYLGK